jgi:hypothetical protein
MLKLDPHEFYTFKIQFSIYTYYVHSSELVSVYTYSLCPWLVQPGRTSATVRMFLCCSVYICQEIVPKAGLGKEWTHATPASMSLAATTLVHAFRHSHQLPLRPQFIADVTGGCV